MKSNKWIVYLFLSFIIITPSITQAGQENGVAHRVAVLEAAVENLITELEAANTEIANLKTELAVVKSNTVLELDGILTYGMDIKGYPRALFTGVNVQIVNGLGATNGHPDDPREVDPLLIQVNGLGNLIVGYNEFYPQTHPPYLRTGSHNIVAGIDNDYLSFGGIVVGRHNYITGVYATVIGGFSNSAGGTYSSVSGGNNNTASGNSSSVSGGTNNNTSGSSSSISGGNNNRASASVSSISGGLQNTATSEGSSILGGQNQSTTSNYETIPAIP